MGFEATGFNLNVPQAKPVNNNTNLTNVDKKASVQNTSDTNNVNDLDLKNKVDVNFNVGKSSSKELKNVNIFEQDSIGKMTMKSVADNSGDITKGSIIEAAKIVLEAIKNAG